jgi:hypothetical protein
MKKQQNQSGFSIIHALLIVVIVAIIGFAGYYVYNAQKNNNETLNNMGGTNPTATEPTPTPTPSITPTSNIFDISQAKAGDKVANMTIKEVVNPSYIVQFSGEQEITGGYYYETQYAEMVCMRDFTKSSLNVIPKEKSDSRPVWFCFDDLESAKSLLGITETGDQGTITLVIDNYRIDMRPAGVFNTATLVEVVD